MGNSSDFADPADRKGIVRGAKGATGGLAVPYPSRSPLKPSGKII